MIEVGPIGRDLEADLGLAIEHGRGLGSGRDLDLD
jgi:hypothetical protein